jgi:hypothetical protein
MQPHSTRAQRATVALARIGRAAAKGDRFTGADVLLTAHLATALRLPNQLGAYLSRTTARVGYQRALKANQRRGVEVFE